MAGKSLICSDVDGTLLGNQVALEAFCKWLEPRRDQFQLAYNSGRSIDSLRQSVASTSLPEPDAYIGNVGTEIEICSDRHTLDDWPNFKGRWDPNEVRSALEGFPSLELQPEIFQSPFKVSYFVFDATSTELNGWQAALDERGLAVQLVYSSERDLDVLPQGVHKGSAAAHLADHWHIASDRVVVCGDSGNDLSMFAQGFYGVVVGNALPELAVLTSSRVYHAEREFAAGVAEGLEHWMTTIDKNITALA